jgi:outer membrane lipoprotein-sorting protein
MPSTPGGRAMKTAISTFFFLGVVSLCLVSLDRTIAQQCDDDESMVTDYKKDLTQLVENTRKESLADFEKGFHQKTCLTKLTLSLSMLNELVSCLEKAVADSTATKEQADANKTKLDAYTKLKDKVEGYRKKLKATDDPKEAKALIEKFNFSS